MDLYKTYISNLKNCVSIKSISTDKSYNKQIKQQVLWLKEYMQKVGFEVKVIKGYGNPVIFGHLKVKNASETVLHYGHYDVQPADTKDGWETKPFELSENKDKLYGRGVVDNKGQFLIYLTAIQNLVKENKLKYNIKFIIEGDEETGSGDLEKFFKDNASLLKCDFALISDGEQINKQPTIDVSYRGSINAKLTVFGPKNDLHSGLYGGIVFNPINEITNLLCKINGRTITKELEPYTVGKNHINNLKDNNFDFAEFKRITGLEAPVFKDPYVLYKSLGFNTAIEITGIKGGFTKQGFKNAIPTKAEAKINLRFPGFYKSNDIVKSLQNLVAQNVPDEIKYELDIFDTAEGVLLSVENNYTSTVKEALTKVYNKDVLYNYCGATLPVAHTLHTFLKVPCIFVGLGNGDCNMHGADENFDTNLVKKGLQFATEVLQK